MATWRGTVYPVLVEGGGAVPVDVNITNQPIQVQNVSVQAQGGGQAIDPLIVEGEGGSLTVDGTVTVSNFPATQDVNITGQPISIDDNGASLTVDGTVAVSAIGTVTQTGTALDTNVASWLGSTAPTIGQQLSALSVPVVLSSDFIVPAEIHSRVPTYSAAIAAGALSNTGIEDVFIITGSGTKTIRVLEVTFDVRNDNNAVLHFPVSFVKRSADNTGGTFTTLTNVPLDSNDAAATAVVRVYSANPTQGAAIGIVATARALDVDINQNNSRNDPTVNFNTPKGESVTLRGAAQCFAVTFNNTTLQTDSNINLTVRWTEEDD